MQSAEQGIENEELRKRKGADLEDRIIDFSIRILNLVEALPNSRACNHIAGQLVRPGTAPAPNYGEAQSAESRKDFIHKMKIALKELREANVWLKMIYRKPLVEDVDRLIPLIQECDDLNICLEYQHGGTKQIRSNFSILHSLFCILQSMFS